MKPLSSQLAELSLQAKNAEDRAREAYEGAKVRVEEQRQQLQEDTELALRKVNEGLSNVSAEAQARAGQLRLKVESDLEQLKHQALESKHKAEAWQANNYADDKEADAAACIDYAIVSVKVAQLAVLDAIDARIRAENKAEQIEMPQPSPA